MRTPIDRGLTASPAYTPFGGYARLDRLVKGLDSADRRSVVWAGVLWAASIGTISALWLDGFRVPHIWAVFVLGAIAAAGRAADGGDRRPHGDVSRVPAARLLGCRIRAARRLRRWSALNCLWIYAHHHSNGACIRRSAGSPPLRPDSQSSSLSRSLPTFGQYLLASLVGSMVFLLADGFFSTATAFVRGIDPAAHLHDARIAFLDHGAALRPSADALRLRLPHLLARARARLFRSDARRAAASSPLPAGKGGDKSLG